MLATSGALGALATNGVMLWVLVTKLVVMPGYNNQHVTRNSADYGGLYDSFTLTAFPRWDGKSGVTEKRLT